MGPSGGKDGNRVVAPSVHNEVIGSYKYDPTHKGWRGPQPDNTLTLKETIMAKKREKQLQKQAEIKLRHHTSRLELEGGDSTIINCEEEDDVADDSVSREFDLGESVILKPFDAHEAMVKNAAWNAPARTSEKKEAGFKWERPSTECVSSSFTSTAQELVRSQAELEARDKEVAILRHQLLKAHAANGQLVDELSKYTGKKYDDLLAENTQLKQNVQRLTHENMKLNGKIRLENNSVRKCIAYKDELDKLHNSATRLKPTTIL